MTSLNQESKKLLFDETAEEDDDAEKAEHDERPNNDNQVNAINKCSSAKTTVGHAVHRRRDAARRILYSELCHEMHPLALGSIAMLASSWTNQALPRLMGRLIDTQSSSSSLSSSGSTNNNNNKNMTTSLAFVILGGGMSSFIRTFLLAKVEASIAARLRTQAVEALLVHKDLQWFQTEQLVHHSNNDINDNDRNGNLQDNSSTSSDDGSAAVVSNHGGGKSAVAAVGISPVAIGAILEEDVNRLAGCLTKTMVNLLRYTSSIVFSTYRMMCLDPALLGISAAVVPLVGATAIILHKTVTRVTNRQRELATHAASFLEERLVHIAMVQMSHRQEDEVQAYKHLQDESMQLARTAALYQGCFMGFIFAASSGALLLVVHSGGRSVARGIMTSGQLATFATYSFLLGLGTSGVVKTMGEWTLAMVSAERYERLVMTNNNNHDDGNRDQVEDTNNSAAAASSSVDNSIVSPYTSNLLCGKGIQVDVNAVESISLRNVCFSYQSSNSNSNNNNNNNNNTAVLKNISFTLKRGQVVALVGRNGSGKSTLASILAGLYLPTNGEIHLVAANNNTAAEVDSEQDEATILTDLCRVDKDCRKRLVQLIPQSTALFNTSILENVRYSNPNATVETVQRALHQAHCDHLLKKLQRQQQQQNDDNQDASSSSSSSSVLDYVVGLNGCKLSGGERQRLALARALVSDPACLVMDEPASSMDTEGEAAIYHALEACRCRRRNSSSISENDENHDNGNDNNNSSHDNNSGRAFLLITHDPKILQEADSIIVLKNGEIVERGTLEELVRDTASHLLTIMPDLRPKKLNTRIVNI